MQKVTNASTAGRWRHRRCPTRLLRVVLAITRLSCTGRTTPFQQPLWVVEFQGTQEIYGMKSV